jgi:hypothetical protein
VKSLPLQGLDADKMTKGVVLRLALQYIKLHKLLSGPDNGCSDNGIWDAFLARSLLKDKRRFFLIVDSSGTIMYVGEQITKLLGPQQVDAIGALLSDMVHAEDCEELAAILAGKGNASTILRMKDTLSPFVRSCEKVKYKAAYVTVLGKYYSGDSEVLMVMECRPFEVCGIPEITVNAFYEWTMDINMNVTDIGWRVPWVRGFPREDIIGKPCLLFVFPEDVDQSSSGQKKAIIEVLKNGSYCAPPMRALMATGDWLWCRTELTIHSTDSKGRITSFNCKDIVLGKYEYESVGHSWKHAGSSENKSLFNQVSSSKRRAIANSVHQPSSWMPAAKAPTTCSRSSTRNTQHPPVCPSASQVCGTKRKFHKFDSECVCTPSSHTTKSCYIMIWCHIRTCTLHCDLPFVTNCIATCHL